MTDERDRFLQALATPSFRRRYNQARLGISVLFVLVLWIAIDVRPSWAGWLAIVLIGSVVGWLLTLRGILCPACYRPAKELDEGGIPILNAPPEQCQKCGMPLS